MLANGEREAGATLHHMVARADAGDIVAQRAVEITDDDTALTLYRKIVPIGAALIREYHPLIASGTAPRRAQDLSARQLLRTPHARRWTYRLVTGRRGVSSTWCAP